jgi:hypothetical protein
MFLSLIYASSIKCSLSGMFLFPRGNVASIVLCSLELFCSAAAECFLHSFRWCRDSDQDVVHFVNNHLLFARLPIVKCEAAATLRIERTSDNQIILMRIRAVGIDKTMNRLKNKCVCGFNR